MATLFVLVFATSLLGYRSRRAESAIEGKPIVLVHDGQLRTRQLDRSRISVGELEAEMRKAGLERLDQVKWAVLESGGDISFIPRAPATRRVGEHPGGIVR